MAHSVHPTLMRALSRISDTAKRFAAFAVRNMELVMPVAAKAVHMR
jgi:hypothetical protein